MKIGVLIVLEKDQTIEKLEQKFQKLNEMGKTIWIKKGR